jgi:hypothetical protein
VNLREVDREFQKLTGAKGDFYRTKYELGLGFKGSELEFKVLHGQKVIASTSAKYL